MTTSDDQREAATRTQPGTPERSALIEAAVKSIVRNFPNETAAWNAWNNLNTTPEFIAAILDLHNDHATDYAAQSTHPALPAGDEGLWADRPSNAADRETVTISRELYAMLCRVYDASRPSPAPTPAADDHAALIADLAVAEELTGTQWADTSPRYYPAMRRIFSFARRVLEGEVKNDVD